MVGRGVVERGGGGRRETQGGFRPLFHSRRGNTKNTGHSLRKLNAPRVWTAECQRKSGKNSPGKACPVRTSQILLKGDLSGGHFSTGDLRDR